MEETSAESDKDPLKNETSFLTSQKDPNLFTEQNDATVSIPVKSPESDTIMESGIESSMKFITTCSPVVVRLGIQENDNNSSDIPLELPKNNIESLTNREIWKVSDQLPKPTVQVHVPDEPPKQDKRIFKHPIFKCVPCNKNFSSEQYLRRHITIHTSPLKKHHCNFCMKRFLTPKELEVHIRTHTGEKSFCCSECGRKFSQPGSLTDHFQRLHGNGKIKKRYECDYCDNKFFKRTELVVHMISHTGERPFPCNECDKAFARVTRLHVHVQRVHRNEKKNICSLCHKGFFAPTDLKYHLKSHVEEREYSCTKCERSFAKPSRLKRHIFLFHKSSIGTNLKQQIKIEPLLDNKLKSQSGNKSFKCKKCIKRFISSSNLKRHINIFHPKIKLKNSKSGSKSTLSTKSSTKTFKKSGNLHGNSSTSELKPPRRSKKSYTCFECGLNISTPYNLKRHLGNVHKIYVKQTMNSSISSSSDKDLGAEICKAKKKATKTNLVSKSNNLVPVHHTHNCSKNNRRKTNKVCEDYAQIDSAQADIDIKEENNNGSQDSRESGSPKENASVDQVCSDDDCEKSISLLSAESIPLEKFNQQGSMSSHSGDTLNNGTSKVIKIYKLRKGFKLPDALLPIIGIPHTKLPNVPIQKDELTDESNSSLPKIQNLSKNRPAQKKSFNCEICGKSFLKKNTLKSHKYTHSTVKPGCKVRSRIQGKGKRLEYRCHSDKKPFKCKDCNKQFSIPSRLKQHALMHSGEKPHGCSNCCKAFGRPDHLKRHESHFHGIGVKRGTANQCLGCKKIFSKPEVLQEHIKTSQTPNEMS